MDFSPHRDQYNSDVLNNIKSTNSTFFFWCIAKLKIKMKFLGTRIAGSRPVVAFFILKMYVNGCSRKNPYFPHGGNFCRPEGEGSKNCF
jgi:hypothetical protein